jgi:hypothetical protein
MVSILVCDTNCVIQVLWVASLRKDVGNLPIASLIQMQAFKRCDRTGHDQCKGRRLSEMHGMLLCEFVW